MTDEQPAHEPAEPGPAGVPGRDPGPGDRAGGPRGTRPTGEAQAGPTSRSPGRDDGAGRPADHPRAGSPRPGRGDFSVEEVRRGRELLLGTWPLAIAASAATLGLTVALGMTGAGAGLVGAFGEGWAVRVVAAAVTLVLLPQALAVPFAARGRAVRARFGLVTQGWGGWAVDRLRALLVSLPLTLGALFAFYALAGTARLWWLWAALGAAAATVALSFLAPLVFEPLFNRFTPMEPGPLRDALLALAARDGVAVRDVLVADASRRTTALNAYVSGFGRTRRIVVYDTLLATAEPGETELVVAHELGHVVHRDVARGTALGAVGAAAGVCVLAAVATRRPLLDAAGVGHLADPRSAWLVAALAAVGGALTGPAVRALSRRIERRADTHALDLTGAPGQFIAMQRRLTVANVADPYPPRLLHLLLSTHPAPGARIAAARDRGDATDAGPHGS